MTDSTDNKRKRQFASDKTDDFLESLTLAQIGAALGYRFDQAATLQAANAEQIKALVESQARTDARIRALTEQVRLLIGCIGQSQAGPVAETEASTGSLRTPVSSRTDQRTGIVMLDNFEQQQRGADAELPDRARVKDVAKWLGLHQGTVYQLIRSGGIPYKRVGKRTYIFEKAALLEWAESSSSVPELAIRRGAG